MVTSADPELAVSADDGGSSKRSSKKAKKASSGGGNQGGVIFFETGSKPGASAAKHALIEAVPVNKNAFLDAPMYFRQVTTRPRMNKTCADRVHVGPQPRSLNNRASSLSVHFRVPATRVFY